jgi:hypothetical protein
MGDKINKRIFQFDEKLFACCGIIFFFSDDKAS